jgi:hypothetical protein
MRSIGKHRRWIILLSAAAAVGFGISSCKKADSDSSNKSPAPAGQSQPAAKAPAQPTPPAVAKPAAPAEAPKAAEKPAPPAAGAASSETKPAPAAGGLVPIPLELPKPMFVGTPQNITGVPNLMKPLGKPREPFLAPPGTTNVALHKDITSSDSNPIIGELSYVTDGDKEASEQSCLELGPMLQWVQIDLGAPQNIYAVVVWHFHRQARVYYDVVVQVSNDRDFISGVTTVFNNDHDNTSGLGVGTDMNYVETNEGKLIDAKGAQGRYVRLYSRGNNADDMNNYIEVEVYGKPVK